MRQAIEEGFILDILKNYTPYNRAFRLADQASSGEILVSSCVSGGAA